LTVSTACHNNSLPKSKTISTLSKICTNSMDAKALPCTLQTPTGEVKEGLIRPEEVKQVRVRLSSLR